MRRILGFAISMILALTLNSQITLTNASFPAAGDTLRVAFDTLAIGITVSPPGGNQVWNLNSLSPSFVQVQAVRPASEGASASNFPSADLVIKTTAGGERYFKSTASSFQLVGFSGGAPIGFGLNVVTSFNPPILERRAPLNFFDVNTANGALLVPFAASDLPPAILALFPIAPDSIRLRLTLNRVDIVDGWGSMSIPGGTYQVLRERRTEYSDSRLDIKIGILPWTDITALFPLPGTGLGRDTTLSYHFFANSSKEPIAVINADHITNQVLSVEYKFNGIISNAQELASGSSINVFPNPAKDEAQMLLQGLTPDLYDFSLINLTGQVVRRHAIAVSGENSRQQLDLHDLDAGIYFYILRIRGGNQVFSGKLVVQSR